jgi:hypothetical protein
MERLGAVRLRPDEIEREERRQRQRREAEIAEAKRQERQLEKELDELEAKLAEGPALPPESPREKRERELEHRIAKLEGRQLPPGPLTFDRASERKEYRLKEALRMRRAERRSQEQTARQQAHEKHCAAQIEDLESRIEAATGELAAEEQRHAEATATIRARRRELQDTRNALLQPLLDGESSEDRLATITQPNESA